MHILKIPKKKKILRKKHPFLLSLSLLPLRQTPWHCSSACFVSTVRVCWIITLSLYLHCLWLLSYKVLCGFICETHQGFPSSWGAKRIKLSGTFLFILQFCFCKRWGGCGGDFDHQKLKCMLQWDKVFTFHAVRTQICRILGKLAGWYFLYFCWKLFTCNWESIYLSECFPSLHLGLQNCGNCFILFVIVRGRTAYNWEKERRIV